MSEFSPERPSIYDRIEGLRLLAKTKNPFVRHVGALIGSGALHRQLLGLRDRQIGQLLIDVVERKLAIASPEDTICRQASRRLIRSEGERLHECDPRRPCPLCHNDMLLRIGIGKPDRLECVSLKCGFQLEVIG